MSDTKRHHVLVGLFLFVAVMLGLASTITDFHTAIQQLHAPSKLGIAARLALVNAIINLAFALFLLSFVASYRNSKTPSTSMDVLGLAVFIRFLITVFLVFQIAKLEGPKNIGAFKFRYVSITGYIFGLFQTLSMLFALIAMGSSEDEDEATTTRQSVPSIESYLDPKAVELSIPKSKPSIAGTSVQTESKQSNSTHKEAPTQTAEMKEEMDSSEHVETVNVPKEEVQKATSTSQTQSQQTSKKSKKKGKKKRKR